MLRKNNKGFTLVELLGVVVILSIVVGITVPVSTSIISESKYKVLGIAVGDAQKFMADQWKIKKTDPQTNTTAFDDYVTKNNVKEFTSIKKKVELLADMGIDEEDVETVHVKINDGIPCIVISKIKKNSKLYNSKYWTASEDDKYATPKQNNNYFYSSCCEVADVLELLNK